MSFGIFLIRQNVIQSIPDELLDAARIDGAGEILIFGRIVVPLLRGAISALGVLAFFQAWTAFAWPLIVATTQDELHGRSRAGAVPDRLHDRPRPAERRLVGGADSQYHAVRVPAAQFREGHCQHRAEGMTTTDDPDAFIAEARAAYIDANAAHAPLDAGAALPSRAPSSTPRSTA